MRVDEWMDGRTNDEKLTDHNSIVILDDAYMIERTSLQNLHHLIVRCCESLSLWKLLCEYQFDVVANKLDEVGVVNRSSIIILNI